MRTDPRQVQADSIGNLSRIELSRCVIMSLNEIKREYNGTINQTSKPSFKRACKKLFIGMNEAEPSIKCLFKYVPYPSLLRSK